MATTIVKRFFRIPAGSCFIFGPRGTGKSTWLHQELKGAYFLDLLHPLNMRLYSAYPEKLIETVEGLSPTQKDIIIDEIQKLPELLDVVHSLIERKQGWRFILTGSSARKLKRSGVNLLAGRATISHMHPLIAAELGEKFDLNCALNFGLIPLVLFSDDSLQTLEGYISLYLKEEVQAEGLVRNIGNFSRFLEIMSFSHAQVLNLNNIARECMVSRALVENYLGILQDLLLCYLLPVFNKRAKRATVTHDKFYYFDVGVFKSLRAQGQLDVSSEINGIALEGLVLQHLQAWNDYTGKKHKLYYWRTKAGNEVDFIVYGGDNFWAIEVKNKKNIFNKDLRGLKAFCDDYPEATPCILYTGKEKMKISNILCLPVELFLHNLSIETQDLLGC